MHYLIALKFGAAENQYMEYGMCQILAGVCSLHCNIQSCW